MTPSLDDSDDVSCVDLYAVVEGRARPNPSTLRSSKPIDVEREKKAREADAALSKQIRESILGKINNNRHHGEASMEKPKGYSTATTTTTIESTTSLSTTVNDSTPNVTSASSSTTTSHIASTREHISPPLQERKSVNVPVTLPNFDDFSLQFHSSSRLKGRAPRRNSMDHAFLSMGGRNEEYPEFSLSANHPMEQKASAPFQTSRRKSLDNSSFFDLPSNVPNNEVSAHSMSTIRISNSSTKTSSEMNELRGSIQNIASQSCLPNLPLLPHSDTTNIRTETAKTVRKKEIQFSKHNNHHPSENNYIVFSKHPRSKSVKEESTTSPTPNTHPRSKSWTSDKMKHIQQMERNKMEESNHDIATRDTNSSSLTTPTMTTTTTSTYRRNNSHYQPESMTESSQYPFSKQSRSQHVDSFSDKGMDEKLEQSPQPPPKVSLSSSGQTQQPSRRQTDGPNVSIYARGSSTSSQMNPPMLHISVSRDDPASSSVTKPRTSRTSTAMRKTRSRSPIMTSSIGTSNNALNYAQHRRQSQSPSVRRKSGTVAPVSSSTTTTTTATNRNSRIQSQGDPSSNTRNTTTSTTIATLASKSTYLTQLFGMGPKAVARRNSNSSGD